MNEVKNFEVFDKSFECRPGMVNQEPYYVMKLDQLLQPEERFVIRTYCGTLDEIGKLISRLDADEWSRGYYAATIAAWEAWQQGDRKALHQVGHSVVPLLTPAKEMCRSCYLINDAEWKYIDKYGCTMLAATVGVDIEQILAYCFSEHRYLKFARYHFMDLQRVHSDKGWVDYKIDDCGIPGMIEKTEDGMIHSWLYVLIEDYATKRAGEDAMQNEKCVDFEKISQVLFVK